MLVGIHSVSVLGRKHVFAHQRDDHRIGVVVSRHIGDGLSVKAVQYQRPLVHVGFRQVCHIEAGIVARHHECVVIAAGSPLDFPTGGQVEHLSVVHDHLDAGISRPSRQHSGLGDGHPPRGGDAGVRLRCRQCLRGLRCLRRRRRLRRGRTLRFFLNIGFCQCFVHGLRLIKRRGRRVCAACRGDRYGRQRHHGEHQKHRQKHGKEFLSSFHIPIPPFQS